MKFLEAKSVNDAIDFARKRIVVADGIVNYGKLTLSTINRINKALDEMIRYFGVGIRVLGTEENLNYYKDNFAREAINKYEYNQKYKIRRINDIDSEYEKIKDNFFQNTFWAHAWWDGIFLNQELWKNDERELKKCIEVFYKNNYSKTRSSYSVIVHEYAHVLNFTKYITNDDIVKLYFDLVDYNKEYLQIQGYASREDKVKMAEIFGSSIWSEDNNFKEFWAEMIACFFEDLHEGSKIIPIDFFEQIKSFIVNKTGKPIED